MTNKELLDFKFVDRTTETRLAEEFLSGVKALKILLVRGYDLAGKNCFVDNIISANPSLTYITIDFKNTNYTSAYKYFIDELEKISNGEFIQYIKKHYTDIVEITGKNVSTLFKIAGNTNASDIITCLTNINRFFLNNRKEQESSVNLITKYINFISKHENLIIVLKNFSNCDEYSLPILYQVISSSIEKTTAKFIVTISEDDWKENKNNIFSFFSYKVSVFPVEIKGFEDASLFAEMLLDIFDFTSEDQNSIKHIFNVCNGYPGEFKRLLSKAYFYNMDLFSSPQGKAKWDAETINKVISSEHNGFDFKNPVIKLIFLIVLFLDINLTYEMIISITKFISNKLHILLLEDNLIEKSIQELLYSYHLLEIKFNDKEYLTIVNSQKKDLLRLEYEKDTILPLLSRYISDYLLSEKEHLMLTIDKESFLSQLALHTYISNYTNWEEINFEFAEGLYKKGDVSIAQKIFLRLENIWDDFNNNRKFIIASCFYDVGKYDYVDRILNHIDIKSCNYEQLMLIVKNNNINMKKKYAVSILDYMLTDKQFNNYKNNILDVKQRILSNIASSRKEAKEIFDILETDFINKKHNYKDFLISSMEYYRGSKVQKNFNILKEEYRKSNNQLMLAELSVNQGFDLFWQGDIEAAKATFKESIASLETLRIHEISYSLNNYANCQMMEGDFKGAISSLRRALIFNESKYTDIVLKTNLMICYAITENNNYYSLFNELKEMIIEYNKANLDISIYLKVSYALGFIQNYIGEELLSSNSKNYLKEAIDLANEYESKTLPYIWFKDWKNEIEVDITKRLNKEKYFDFHRYRFDPWLLTITHD